MLLLRLLKNPTATLRSEKQTYKLLNLTILRAEFRKIEEDSARRVKFDLPADVTQSIKYYPKGLFQNHQKLLLMSMRNFSFCNPNLVPRGRDPSGLRQESRPLG